MEDEKVKQLAETLKKQGLAASMFEAIEKAKSILNVSTEKNEGQQETKQNIPENEVIQKEQSDKFSSPDYDVTKEKVSLNELMKEVGVEPEQVEAQEKEKIEGEITQIKEEMKEAEVNPEKVEHAKEEISKVNEEVNETMEARSESEESNQSEQTNEPKEENPEQEDRFKDEKEIDLTKVFNYKK